LDVDRVGSVIREVVKEVSKVIIGKREEVEVIVSTLFSGGHVLIEGYPGTAKTLLAKSLARSIGGVFKRVQGNPDILPSDITGFHVYSIDGRVRFVEGPIFANIVMVDEINRITPRAQSALLEAMQENQVTVDGVTYKLPQPFLVLATQIPASIGTGIYPLTETLIDRFASSIFSGYNEPVEEYEMVTRSDELVSENVETVTSPSEVVEIMEAIRRIVHVSERVVKYIVDIAVPIPGANTAKAVIAKSRVNLVTSSTSILLVANSSERDLILCLSSEIIEADTLFRYSPIVAHFDNSLIHHWWSTEIKLNVFW